MWIERLQASLLAERLSQFAAVVLLGPRQVGKTTLARQLGAQLGGAGWYVGQGDRFFECG